VKLRLDNDLGTFGSLACLFVIVLGVLFMLMVMLVMVAAR
jgi:hypothetical protein